MSIYSVHVVVLLIFSLFITASVHHYEQTFLQIQVNPLYKIPISAPENLVDENEALRAKLLELVHAKSARGKHRTSMRKSHGGVSFPSSDDIALFSPTFVKKEDEQALVSLVEEAEVRRQKLVAEAESTSSRKLQGRSREKDYPVSDVDHADLRSERPRDIIDAAIENASDRPALPLSPREAPQLYLEPIDFSAKTTEAERFKYLLGWLHEDRTKQFWSW